MRNRSGNKVSVTLIRHGETEGNRLRRYIGSTDEGICDTSCFTGDYGDCDILISSPMKRCLQSAKRIYPKKTPVICDKLRECDFGIFENKSFEDLKDNDDYRQWVDSGCAAKIPNGESMAELIKRSAEGFFENLPESGSVAYVIHGGNIMAIMQAIFGGGFYDYHVKNGGGFKFILEDGHANDYSAIYIA